MDQIVEMYHQQQGHGQMVEDEEGMRIIEDDMEHIEQQNFAYAEEDELTDGMAQQRAVHQCNVCNKIFVSYKGLQQHSVIHTDMKPFNCDICGKSFRFKSNLFEHRSVHTGFTPHACPYCGKTCRLKGNLKKHLKTHVSTKEELEDAWRPFASNRRPPADIPDDAIIVRSAGGPFISSTPSRSRKKKLGLGNDSRIWVEKIRRGELLPSLPIEQKIQKLQGVFFNADHQLTLEEVFEQAKCIPFERYDCPYCKTAFLSRVECFHHSEVDHPTVKRDRSFFCEICLKNFLDQKSFDQHDSYHKRVQLMMEHGEIDKSVPEILLPDTSDGIEEEQLAAVNSQQPEPNLLI
ncbi:hypothetical protein WR25_13511 [Diploscapter pachys]|uniref:C2H2-type domain-containing protein n=1 Tax=Diploscapter pachys TaxID=2018661 RepID=A0A2A2JVY1_9BILA|nr:hypothetical protein WR25_13511 [Diploscapter pachys]